MNENKTHYRHFVERGVTFAYRIIGWKPGQFRIDLAEARTAPQDQFSRKLGRQIAEGRLDCPRNGIKHRWNSITVPVDGMPITSEEWRKLEADLLRHARVPEAQEVNEQEPA